MYLLFLQVVHEQFLQAQDPPQLQLPARKQNHIRLMFTRNKLPQINVLKHTYSLSSHKDPLLFCKYLQVLREKLLSILLDVSVLFEWRRRIFYSAMRTPGPGAKRARSRCSCLRSKWLRTGLCTRSCSTARKIPCNNKMEMLYMRVMQSRARLSLRWMRTGTTCKLKRE